MDMEVLIRPNETGASVTGYNILWGHEREKLYHNQMLYGKTRCRIGALVKGTDYYVRVDAFNEAGITEGVVQKLQSTSPPRKL